MPFTEEQLTAMRGGLTAEEYRWKLIREVCDKTPGQQAPDEVSHEIEVRNNSDCWLRSQRDPGFRRPTIGRGCMLAICATRPSDA